MQTDSIRHTVHILSLISVTGFSIFFYIYNEKNIEYPWLFFIVELFSCIITSLTVYNQLDNIYPPVLFDDKIYKNKISFSRKTVIWSIYCALILLTMFLLFLSALYVINFRFISGILYLQLIHSVIFFSTILFFLNNVMSDFSGHAYCEAYQSQTSEKIKFHWIPRTLNEEMMKMYLNDPYSFH